jgi:hypothetical protein
MTGKDLQRLWRAFEVNLAETRIRIRRYTLDPRLREPEEKDLRDAADAAWDAWMKVREAFYNVKEPTEDNLRKLEADLLRVDRQTDLLQRDLISNRSRRAGTATVAWLSVVLVALAAVYLALHHVRWGDFSQFEPLAEWGPLKYVEVAFWGTFGTLCALLYFATYYLMRRDFDEWYRGWYVSTLLRAPFLTVILMMPVLEFAEWYGEDKWIQTYLLEEGNKFYFIAFLSFMLGIMIFETSDIIRELGDGVVAFVRSAVARVSHRLASALSRPDTSGK